MPRDDLEQSDDANLDKLDGERLPDRTVMSIVDPGYDGGFATLPVEPPDAASDET